MTLNNIFSVLEPIKVDKMYFVVYYIMFQFSTIICKIIGEYRFKK